MFIIIIIKTIKLYDDIVNNDDAENDNDDGNNDNKDDKDGDDNKITFLRKRQWNFILKMTRTNSCYYLHF